MKATAWDEDGHPITGADVARKDAVELPVPFREITITESIATGFRQEMLELRTDDGYGGSVATGAGWGSDFITLEWNGRCAVVRGSELLKAWVSIVSPQDVKRFP
jgi:hypothetical protein